MVLSVTPVALDGGPSLRSEEIYWAAKMAGPETADIWLRKFGVKKKPHRPGDAAPLIQCSVSIQEAVGSIRSTPETGGWGLCSTSAMAHGTWKQDGREFKDILCYRLSLRPDWAT